MVAARTGHSTYVSPRRRAGVVVGLVVVLGAAAIALWSRAGDPAASVDDRPAGFTLAGLADATIDIPEFDGCGGGRLRFANGVELPEGGRMAPAVRLVDATAGDIFDNGVPATVLLVGCPAVHGDAYQALVLGLDRADTIVTRSVMAHVDGSEYAFTAVRIPAAGTVEIQYVLPWSGNMTRQQQWRAFTWTGRTWVRAPGTADSSGPVVPVGLSVSRLVLHRSGGEYTGRTTATVRNDSRQATGWLLVSVRTQNRLRLDGPAQPDQPGSAPVWSFPVGPVPPGVSRTIQLDFRAPGTFPSLTTFIVTVISATGPAVATADGPPRAVVTVTTG